MNNDETEARIEAALQRIIDGKPQRIDKSKKLSVSAVQKEAGLGQGSIYYYPALVDKIKRLIIETKAKDSLDDKPKNDVARLRAEKKKEIQVKENYRDQVDALKDKLKQAAADHHRLAYMIYERDKIISDLNFKLKIAKQSQIRSL